MEFTTPIGVMGYYTIIVPLRFQDNLLSITEPLSFTVWICFLISIPVCILAMIVMNYLYTGSTNYERAASSVIRSVLSQNISPLRYNFQKLLIVVWVMMMVIFTSAYKGNLLAIITKPTMNTPFTNAEGMVEQNEVKWAVGDTLFTSYAKSKSVGTPLRTINDQEAIPSTTSTYCGSIAKDFENLAIICDISMVTSIMANDFSKTGACNYYSTQDKILATDNVLAFQASQLLYKVLIIKYAFSAEGKPISGRL